MTYLRNRYYDPATGRFTQEDPAGLGGGMNAYGFAGGDPVNGSDPTGLWCENRASSLHCEDLGPGDFGTIRDYLGGTAGADAYRTFERAGLTNWNNRNCQGGFTSAQCGQIASVQSRLTLHTDAFCANLGVRSTRRFQGGHFAKNVGLIRRWYVSGAAVGLAMFGTTTLSDELFADGEYGPGDGLLYITNVHEEQHHTFPFRNESAAIGAESRCK